MYTVRCTAHVVSRIVQKNLLTQIISEAKGDTNEKNLKSTLGQKLYNFVCVFVYLLRVASSTHTHTTASNSHLKWEPKPGGFKTA